jgi:hypothetical protein
MRILLPCQPKSSITQPVKQGADYPRRGVGLQPTSSFRDGKLKLRATKLKLHALLRATLRQEALYPFLLRESSFIVLRIKVDKASANL